jgi:hypothetical protein
MTYTVLDDRIITDRDAHWGVIKDGSAFCKYLILQIQRYGAKEGAIFSKLWAIQREKIF